MRTRSCSPAPCCAIRIGRDMPRARWVWRCPGPTSTSAATSDPWAGEGRRPLSPIIAAGEEKMIDLYYWTTPNGHKIAFFLEEAGLAYTIKPINIGKGEQFDPDFLKISPNNRIP